MDIFNKVSKLREELNQSQISGMELQDIKHSCQRLANNWQYKSPAERKKIRLSEDDVKVYEFLIEHNYKPTTVYKWLLLYLSHPEVKSKLEGKKVSQRNAFRLKKHFRSAMKQDEEALSKHLIELVRRYIR